MDIVNRMCGSYIHLIPRYRKMWREIVSFNKRYPSRTEYTYTDFFLHNVGVGVFFSNYHYPRGFSEKLFYFIGCKTGWLKRYKHECDVSMDKARKMLEECFTPELQKLMEEENNE